MHPPPKKHVLIFHLVRHDIPSGSSLYFTPQKYLSIFLSFTYNVLMTRKRPAVSKFALSCCTFIGKTCSLIDNIIKIYEQCVDLRSVHIKRKRTRKLSLMFVIYYRSPTKLREGNVFSGVCCSVHRWGVGIHGVYTLPLGTTKAGGTYPTRMLFCSFICFACCVIFFVFASTFDWCE